MIRPVTATSWAYMLNCEGTGIRDSIRNDKWKAEGDKARIMWVGLCDAFV